jgi:hypothetical protein
VMPTNNMMRATNSASHLHPPSTQTQSLSNSQNSF